MRTNLILIILTAIVVVSSGCVDSTNPTNQNNSLENSSDSLDSEKDKENTETASTEKPDYSKFDIIELEAPNDARIGSRFNLTIQVENIGNESSKFSTNILITSRDNDSFRKYKDVESPEVVEPNQETSFKIPLSFNNLDTYTFSGMTQHMRYENKRAKLADTGIEPPSIELGQSVENNQDILMTAENLRFEDADEEGKHIAVIDFSARNNADEPKQLPSRTDFEFIAAFKGKLVNVTEFGKMYESSQVQPGETSEGTLTFQLSDNYGKEDFDKLEWRVTDKTEEGLEIGQDAVIWNPKTQS
ncbi:hypothetical protein ACK3SF_00780 [Candidatus Nanosalina sp. VS9-1]|uniref:hypothetical protein n=1 Tax=Candidatus Nanosalina sp. VS9-1 TaxID=3388566 RepID=UPI0039E1E207